MPPSSNNFPNNDVRPTTPPPSSPPPFNPTQPLQQTRNIPVYDAPVSNPKHSKLFLVTIILIAIGAGGIYFYLQNKPIATNTVSDNQVSTSTIKSTVFSDFDLIISYATTSVSDNSAPAFNAIKADSITKADLDFLSKYLSNYSSKNLPPLTQSQKILSKYSEILAVFDANANKEYRCSLVVGDVCALNSVRNIANLAVLRSTVYFQQNKYSQAATTSLNVVSLGKNITANTNDVLALLVGWSVQGIGYDVLSTIRSVATTTPFSDSEKANLILKLRQEHKRVLKSEYTKMAQKIDYITSSISKPSVVISADEEELISSYRDEIATSSIAWNAIKTKKYFYDSYKIALSNTDLPCGAGLATSTIEVDFNPQNQDRQIENYVGKTLYTAAYSSVDGLNQKRCAVEELIQNL